MYEENQKLAMCFIIVYWDFLNFFEMNKNWGF